MEALELRGNDNLETQIYLFFIKDKACLWLEQVCNITREPLELFSQEYVDLLPVFGMLSCLLLCHKQKRF